LICVSVDGIPAKATLATKCPSQEHISPTIPELSTPEQLTAVETSTIQPTTIEDAAMPCMPNVEITTSSSSYRTDTGPGHENWNMDKVF
jgi:hypothetical protein